MRSSRKQACSKCPPAAPYSVGMVWRWLASMPLAQVFQKGLGHWHRANRAWYIGEILRFLIPNSGNFQGGQDFDSITFKQYLSIAPFKSAVLNRMIVFPLV